jgi:hypothetical protein
MQKVLFGRYEKRLSTIITSNIPWEAWGDYLDDHLGAAAILDRLIHRSRVIVINDGPHIESMPTNRKYSATLQRGTNSRILAPKLPEPQLRHGTPARGKGPFSDRG